MAKIPQVEQIVAHIEASGDRSVGMMPTSFKITIEGMDMKRDIEDCYDSTDDTFARKMFSRDIQKLFQDWLDYGAIGVSFDDECYDCVKVLKRKKSGKGYKKHLCPMLLAERR